MKKINLAKAICNRKCLGFCHQLIKGKYEYQNDNDLGLCLDDINGEVTYNKKLYIGKGYYIYVMRGIWGCDERYNKDYLATLNTVALLAKECHPHLFELTTREKHRLNKYWGFTQYE